MALTIRPMTERDVPAVLALYRACHPGWQERPAEFYTTANRTFVATVGKRVVGYSVLGLVNGDGVGFDTGVDPAYQGRGIGRRLHDHKVQAARAAGAKHFMGITWAGNTAMTKILTGSGFVQVMTVPEHFAESPTRDDGGVYVMGLDAGR